MAIEIKDVRTITLTGADRFTTTVRQGLMGEAEILVESLSYVWASTGRLGRTARLRGHLVGYEDTQAHGSLWLAELPVEMADALFDERPAPIEVEPEPTKEPTDA